MDPCEHLANLTAVEPATPDGCQECLDSGSHWVHLRLCMTCGHVGCCDSSPNRHATAHSKASDHSVIQSFEPGEEWAWCREHNQWLHHIPAELIRP